MKADFGTLNEPIGRSFQSIPDILSRREAAAYLGVCKTTLDRLDIPRTRVRHRVMYKWEVINKWIGTPTEPKGAKVPLLMNTLKVAKGRGWHERIKGRGDCSPITG